MTWHPASNGAGKRHWFVTAGVGRDHEDARGRLIRYASLATAQAAADRLNRAAPEFGPRREGSPRCQSGSIASGGTRTFCTCDTCF